LLAATIQTSNLKDLPIYLISIELFSWFCLLISGLSCLSYLENTSVLFKHDDAFDKYEDNPELIEKFKKSYLTLDRSMSIKYKTAKYGFILGLILVAVSRALQGTL